MACRMGELRMKEVISVTDGGRLGYVSDIEIDIATARIEALVVWGRPRPFGLLGRDEDIVVKWEDIEKIGEDIVLVKAATPEHPQSLLQKLWYKLTGQLSK